MVQTRRVVLVALVGSALGGCGESRRHVDVPVATAGRGADAASGGEGTSTGGSVGGGHASGGAGRGGAAASAGAPAPAGGGPAGGAGATAGVGGREGGSAGVGGASGEGPGRAGSDGAAGAAGAAGAMDCGSESPLALAQATALATEVIVRANPGLASDTTFELAELGVAGLWEALHAQLFNVSFLSAEGQVFRQEAYARHGTDLTLMVSQVGTQGLSSAVVSGDALYYSYSFGSGVVRSNIGRLRVRDCALERLENGGYAQQSGFSVLFLKLSTDVLDHPNTVSAETGSYAAFNVWHDATWVATLAATDTTLDLVGEDGQVIPPGTLAR